MKIDDVIFCQTPLSPSTVIFCKPPSPKLMTSFVNGPLAYEQQNNLRFLTYGRFFARGSCMSVRSDFRPAEYEPY